MKKITKSVFAVALIALALTSCNSSTNGIPGKGSTYTPGDDNNPSELDLKVGDTLKINLHKGKRFDYHWYNDSVVTMTVGLEKTKP